MIPTEPAKIISKSPPLSDIVSRSNPPVPSLRAGLGDLLDVRNHVHALNLLHDNLGLGDHDGLSALVQALDIVSLGDSLHLRHLLDDLDASLELLGL